MRKLKFAVYGCGAIARTHAEAIMNIENAELYACADLSDASALAFAEKYTIKKHDSLDALCADADIDVINVCYGKNTSTITKKTGKKYLFPEVGNSIMDSDNGKMEAYLC